LALSNPKDAYEVTANIPFHEAGLLKLNCDKALGYLNWQATLDYKDTINLQVNGIMIFIKLQRICTKKHLTN
jgi:CDP-glucose 4,6-dehydratase